MSIVYRGLEAEETMGTRGTGTYRELKVNLSAPARRVIEELIDRRRTPEDVLRRLVRDEGCDDTEAYGYVREVLYRSAMELTGAEARPPLIR